MCGANCLAADAKQNVSQSDQYLPSKNESELGRGSVIEWAIESHDHARDRAYAFGPDKRLDEPYAKEALPVVEVHLARTGVRLAVLLNQALGECIDS